MIPQRRCGSPMLLAVVAAALLLSSSAFSPILHAGKQQQQLTVNLYPTSQQSASRQYRRSPTLCASSASSDPPTSTATTTKKRKLQSFSRYLEVECWKQQPDVRQLEQVLQSFADACKQINRIVQRAQTDELYGNFGPDTKNVQGETPQKLDVLCNTVMLQSFCGTGGGRSIHAVASEEEEHPRLCETVMNDVAFRGGDFLAVFDPIDGSKNIDASLPVGTIFGVYRKPHTATSKKSSSANGEMSQQEETEEVEKLFHQDGSALVAAGYCLYSATTVLVMTLGSGVDGFTLDPDTGRFLHTHQDMRIPQSGPIYSFNEANFHDFSPQVQRYLDALKEGSSSVGVRSNARYLGSLVADVHNVLINGGIYGYPATTDNPQGKLRLLYESAPMAMLMEQAGGAGSTGHGRLMDVLPTRVHERVPTFLGSIDNVYELDQFCKYYADDNDA